MVDNAILMALHKKSVEQILKECNQYESIPVDIKKILKDLNILAVEDDFKDLENIGEIKEVIKKRGNISGIFLANSDVKIIYKANKIEDMTLTQMNNAVTSTRITLARGLAYYCLHADYLEDGYIDFNCNREIFVSKEMENTTLFEHTECEVNTLASALLIPEHSLKEILNKLIVPSLQALIIIFDVSENMMRERLKHLNIAYVDDVF